MMNNRVTGKITIIDQLIIIFLSLLEFYSADIRLILI